MENPYVAIDINSFEDSKNYRTGYTKYDFSNGVSASFKYLYLTSPKSAAMYVKVDFDIRLRIITDGGTLVHIPKYYPDLEHGNLIIQLNDSENNELEPFNTSQDCDDYFQTTSEQAYYEIDKELLIRICNASSLKMQISGSGIGKKVINDGSFLIFYAKALYNALYDETAYVDEIEAQNKMKEEEKARNEERARETGKACYVATCIYGSYDCPQVWTLRRFRDFTLDETWYGRLFIKTYYFISPTIVKWFGQTEWFRRMCKEPLDKLVAKLNVQGVDDTPYNDKK